MFAGGEGATAREVLRHKTVEKLVMVDIDKVGARDGPSGTLYMLDWGVGRGPGWGGGGGMGCAKHMDCVHCGW